jgi:hypothetical protein
MKQFLDSMLALVIAAESLRAATAAPPTINAVTPVVANGKSALSVGQYEKLELGVDLTAAYDNPFDPDEVDLSASPRPRRVRGVTRSSFATAMAAL